MQIFALSVYEALGISMEAHTPKRQAIEKFVEAELGKMEGWKISVTEEKEQPIVILKASKPGHADDAPKSLEVHTRQVTLTHDELDESTQKLISRWMVSLERQD